MTLRRVVLVVWSGGGNLPPMLELTSRLSALGHDVTVTGPASLTESVTRRGARMAERSALEQPDVNDPELESAGRGLGETLFGAASARAVASVLHEYQAEVAVVDCMHFAGLCGAEMAGVSTIPFLHLRYGFFTEGDQRRVVDEGIGSLVRRTREELGLTALDPDESLARQMWGTPSRALSMVPASLETSLTTPPSTLVRCGPLFPRPPRAPEEDRDHIFVSFSTTAMDQGPVIGRVLAALGSLDAPVTCTLGRVTIPTLEVPHNVSVVDWMDPFDVLARTQLVVTHAGMGTTLAALAHGVPMLALPMGRDQDGNAERIAQLGAGLALPPTSEVPDIRAATQRILDDPAFASAAHGVATEIAALDNGRSAVETVASLK